MMKKILVLILCVLFLFGTYACSDPGKDSSGPANSAYTSADSTGSDTTVDKTGYNLSDYTEYVYSLGAITGITSKNYTDELGVGGTDLGFPVYDETRDRMYFCFGDTFTGYENNHFMSGQQRGSTIGYVDDWTNANFPDNIKFTSWLTDENGMACAVAGSHLRGSSARYECSKIPTGGICVNGTLYVFLMSVRSWSVGGVWDINFNGVVKSADGGKTWERVFDLTWVENDSGVYAETIKEIAEQNCDLTKSGVDLNLTERAAPNFLQITAADGKDGYIYIFGGGRGRTCGMEMARVQKENFEDFDSYEYFTGYDASQAPVWKKGTEGLAVVRNNELLNSNDNLLIKNRMGETTVFYNPYFDKWIMTDNIDNVIYMSMSKNIYGPYSTKKALLNTSYDHGRENAYYELYAGFSHEKLLADDGQTMYMVVSYMDKIYNSYLMEMRFW